MAGRPSKPRDFHILGGTFREDRHGADDEIITGAGEPKVPERFRGDLLEVWQAIVPRLVQMGVAKQPDQTALELLCEWLHRYRKWSKALDRMGIENKKFSKVLYATTEAWKQFDRLASRFGLTPSDRQKIRVTDPKKKPSVTSRRNA